MTRHYREPSLRPANRMQSTSAVEQPSWRRCLLARWPVLAAELRGGGARLIMGLRIGAGISDMPHPCRPAEVRATDSYVLGLWDEGMALTTEARRRLG